MRIPDIDSLFEKVDITKYPVKKMVAIPLIILLIAFVVLACTQVRVDSPVRLGIDFTGGKMVKITTDETIEDLTAKFADYPVVLIAKTTVGNEKTIRFGPMSDSQTEALENMLDEEYEKEQYELPLDVSPLFGKESQKQAVRALLIAFTLMAIVVFVVFRAVIPPLAVIFAAFSDIVIAVACMDLIRMELSLGTVAALLMLIGYSVDSDILLTTNLLHKKGDLNGKVRNAMKTGITMTFTTMSAIFAMFLVSSFFSISILWDISIVLLFGLTVDLLNTWLFNAGILRWYMEKKERKKYGKRSVKSGGNKKKAKNKSKSSTV